MRPLSRLASLLAPALAAIILATPARAASCDSTFDDVPDGANYCLAAQWLKSRSITLGCSDTAHFCPDQAVTRGAMALFLNRLGTVLTPYLLHTNDVTVTVDAATPGGVVTCRTDAYDVIGYNRVATGGATVLFYSGAGQAAMARLVYSTDNGSTWNSWATYWMAATVPAAAYASVASMGQPVLFFPGDSVIFGLNAVAASGEVAADCELNVRIENTNQVL